MGGSFSKNKMLSALLVGSGLLTTTGGLLAKDKCAPILQAAEVARNDFATKLGETPADSDYERFANDIDNYNVGLSDAGDSFIVYLKLKSKDGGVVLGGAARYRIRKSDLSIEEFVGLE